MVVTQVGAALPVVGGLLIVVAGIVVYSAIEIVDAYEKKPLVVHGEFRRVLEPGVNVVPPFVSATKSIDMRTQEATPRIEATTADNRRVTVEAAVEVSVADAERVFQETDGYRRALLEAANESLEAAVAEVEFTDLRERPADVADRVRLTMERRTAGWGIDLGAVELASVEAAGEAAEA